MRFQFHGLYFLSYFLAMVGVILFSAKKWDPPPDEEQIVEERIPVNENIIAQDNISRY